MNGNNIRNKWEVKKHSLSFHPGAFKETILLSTKGVSNTKLRMCIFDFPPFQSQQINRCV